MIATELKDRMRGSLLGVCCGDALGAPIELKSRKEVEAVYPDGVDGFVKGWGKTARRYPGHLTDDSKMTICLLKALVDGNGFTPEGARASYMEWVNTGTREMGRTIRRALKSGKESPDSEANGTLMRIAPVALYAVCHPGWDWAGAAAEDARITHTNPKCAKANIIYVESIILALQGKTPQEIYECAIKRAEALQEPALLQLLQAAATEEPEYCTNEGWLHHAFQATYYWMLHATDFRSAMLTVVNRLGDPDTNGAIVGAMLGAMYGESSYPEEWLQVLLKPRRTKSLYTVEKALALLERLPEV